MHTIRGKIRLAYLTFAFIIGAISLLAFLDLHYLDLRIEQGAVIAQLKENGLEMRRHEKNFFLYADEGSRQEALRLAHETKGILEQESDALQRVISDAERSQLIASLAGYTEQLASLTLPNVAAADTNALRDSGHAISETLAGMAQRERTILRASVTQSQRTLLFSIAALGKYATGLMSKHVDLANELTAAGEHVFDRGWRLRLWDEYQSLLESTFADVYNIGGRWAGAITAGCFLSRFAEGQRWAHLDIAGVANDEGKRGMATGRPVGLLSQWLLDRSRDS